MPQPGVSGKVEAPRISNSEAGRCSDQNLLERNLRQGASPSNLSRAVRLAVFPASSSHAHQPPHPPIHHLPTPLRYHIRTHHPSTTAPSIDRVYPRTTSFPSPAAAATGTPVTLAPDHGRSMARATIVRITRVARYSHRKELPPIATCRTCRGPQVVGLVRLEHADAPQRSDPFTAVVDRSRLGEPCLVRPDGSKIVLLMADYRRCPPSVR